MSNKPTQNDTLKARLARSREIHISVTGRKSGRTISIPVWFELDDDKLYLLPVRRLNSKLFRSPTPNRCRPWSRNSAASTGRMT